MKDNPSKVLSSMEFEKGSDEEKQLPLPKIPPNTGMKTAKLTGMQLSQHSCKPLHCDI